MVLSQAHPDAREWLFHPGYILLRQRMEVVGGLFHQRNGTKSGPLLVAIFGLPPLIGVDSLPKAI